MRVLFGLILAAVSTAALADYECKFSAERNLDIDPAGLKTLAFALGSSDVYFSRTISTPQRKSGYFPSFKSDTPFDHASDTAQGVPSLVAHRACHLAQGDRVQASASNAGRLVPNHVVLNRAEFLYTSAI